MQMIFKSQSPEREIHQAAPCDTALNVIKYEYQVQMFILVLNMVSLRWK